MRQCLLGGSSLGILLLGVAVSRVDARVRDLWPSWKLSKNSDLIAIVQVISTGDANKASKPPKGYEELVGVDSRFRVLAVLKGKHKAKELVLFHFRTKKQPQQGRRAIVNPGTRTTRKEVQTPDLDGPCLVSFDPAKKRTRYLIFLTARPDGRYECVSGQIDPNLSVAHLEGSTDDE